MDGKVSAIIAARYPSLMNMLVLIVSGFMSLSWVRFALLAKPTGISMHVAFVTRAVKRNRTWINKNEAMEEW
jgi:hypothetical protein